MSVNTWERVVRGDKDAFLALYQSHYQALFYYGFNLSSNRELTKDCIQELFLEIWNKRPSLNKEVKNVRSYLFTWLRRKISRELSMLAKEKKEQLRLALQKLTKKQLEIIRLKFYENLSYQAIASKTSLTPRTVYNLVYEGIRHLRESMKLLLIPLMI